MCENPWHHGDISRPRAETILSSSSDGVFLVRDSTTFPGEHVLSVSCDGHVIHYRVFLLKNPVTKHQGFTIDNEEFFDTVTDLIHHYQRWTDGLCTKLVRGIPKPSKTDVDDFQTRYFRPLQVEAIEKLKWRKLKFARKTIVPAVHQEHFETLDIDSEVLLSRAM